jgi:hypothetical protein
MKNTELTADVFSVVKGLLAVVNQQQEQIERLAARHDEFVQTILKVLAHQLGEEYDDPEPRENQRRLEAMRLDIAELKRIFDAKPPEGGGGE